MWQPIGVTFATAVAFGTAGNSKYRCAAKLKSCHAVAAGTPCCTVSSNMGWRYEAIILGGITLLVFFLRYFVFHFYESPKFLLSQGKEQEAIDVLHKIAKFNRAPAPVLTVEMFREMDAISGVSSAPVQKSAKQSFSQAFGTFLHSFKHLKGLFANKLQLFIFVLLAIAYMVCLHF